jgi:hypothetical protein
MGGVHTFSVAERYLYDINNSGAFVATDLTLDRGCPIQVEIVTPGNTVLKPVSATVAHCARDRENVPGGMGIRFLAETIEEHDRISDIVMSTLALDLLDFGYRKRKKPAAKPKETGGTTSHPIRWKRPPENRLEGPTETTLRFRAGEQPDSNDVQAEDLKDLWNLDEVLQGLSSPALRQ